MTSAVSYQQYCLNLGFQIHGEHFFVLRSLPKIKTSIVKKKKKKYKMLNWRKHRLTCSSAPFSFCASYFRKRRRAHRFPVTLSPLSDHTRFPNLDHVKSNNYKPAVAKPQKHPEHRLLIQTLRSGPGSPTVARVSSI